VPPTPTTTTPAPTALLCRVIRRRPHKHRNQATTITTTTTTTNSLFTLAVFNGEEENAGRGMDIPAEGVNRLRVKVVVVDDEGWVKCRVVLGMYSEEWERNARGTYNPGGSLHTSTTAKVMVVFHSPYVPTYKRQLF